MLSKSKQQILRLSFIWLQHYCYNLAAYPSALLLAQASDEPPSNADIRGITAHKVYPINALLQKPVSSYLTFSPWPPHCYAKLVEAQQCGGGNFLWHFLPNKLEPAVNRCVALCCPDFPDITFVTPDNPADRLQR